MRFFSLCLLCFTTAFLFFSARHPNIPVGRLHLIIQDAATHKLTPVRVRITYKKKPVNQLPDEAIGIMYGLWDHEDGFGFQPDSSFYVAGKLHLSLPAGTYEVTLSKGNEYLDQQHTLVVRAGQATQKTFVMNRWINMANRGWYSADGHIHIRRSPREDPFLLNWIQAENLNVGLLLRMGDFWETYYPQYAYGEKGTYQRGQFLLAPGQEDPRTPELGHALGYGMSNRVRFRNDYYYYDKVFDRLHELGGLTGYAHHAESFHGYRGLVLDGLRGKVDMLEILQFCLDENPLHTEQYYHLLDLGFPLTAIAGSDFPWCGNDHGHGPPERSARLGNARFYTHINGSFNYQSWKENLKAGHTFVSSGPLLQFSVNDALPGDQITVKRGSKLTIQAEAFGHTGQVPLKKLEIIGHGQVLGQVNAGTTRQSASHLTLTLQLDSLQQGIWLSARCYAGPKQAAHTTPIYVSVDGGGFHNPVTLEKYLTLSEQYLRELESELNAESTNPEFRLWYYKKGLKTRIAETQEVIHSLRKKLMKP